MRPGWAGGRRARRQVSWRRWHLGGRCKSHNPQPNENGRQRGCGSSVCACAGEQRRRRGTRLGDAVLVSAALVSAATARSGCERAALVEERVRGVRGAARAAGSCAKQELISGTRNAARSRRLSCCANARAAREASTRGGVREVACQVAPVFFS
jgi:hypothetical protein